MNTRSLLREVADYAADWLDALPERPVGPAHTPAQMRITEALGDGPLPVDEVIADLAREAAPGLTAINSPRFFGFVMGGAHPAGIAADWLATAWDQNAGLASPTPRRPPSRRWPAGGWRSCSRFRRPPPSPSSPAVRWRT